MINIIIRTTAGLRARRLLRGAILGVVILGGAFSISAAAATGAAAGPAPQAARYIEVTGEGGARQFTLIQTLDFLRQGYTDASAATDPLSFARDLCLRGRLLAEYLRHSNELSRAGFFEERGPQVRQAVSASLNPEFVSAEMAEGLTAKDVMALHAVVYATSGPAVYDQFVAEKTTGASLEGRSYAYLAELAQTVIEARDRILEVRSLSGMYGPQTATIASTCATAGPAACAAKPAASCGGAAAADHKCSGACKAGSGEADHKCSGTCKTDGKCSGACKTGGEAEHKCSGACKTGGGEADHKCSGACKTGGGEAEHKCSGTCKTGGGEAEHKCSGTCKTDGGKCSGTCKADGKCSGKCQPPAPQVETGLAPDTTPTRN